MFVKFTNVPEWRTHMNSPGMQDLHKWNSFGKNKNYFQTDLLLECQTGR